MLTKTWDGPAVSFEPPFGARFVVLLDGSEGHPENLLLHRRALPGAAVDES